MRKTIIAGNWKMYKTVTQAIELVNLLKRGLADISGVEIVVCPPFTALGDVRDVILETNIRLGAQNVHYEKEGAFTGEIAAPMLREIGCEYVIIGHSERRQYFQETSELVNRKVKASLAGGLKTIVCVGEKLDDRKAGKTFDIVRSHVEGSLAGLSPEQMRDVVIAYEPVWAIGTGVNATKEQAQEVHAFIRKLLKARFGDAVAQETTIQYGGSVKPENIKDLIGQEDVDGALVGGASLKADSFITIVKNSL